MPAPPAAQGQQVILWNDDPPLAGDLGVGGFGVGRMYFDDPIDLAVNVDDEVLVLDALNDRVQVFDEEGRFVRLFTWPREPAARRKPPAALAVSPEDGSVYVLGALEGKVVKFDAQGRFVLSFGRSGLGKGTLENAVDLTVDDNGYVYVLDRARKTVSKWHKGGTWIEEWGNSGPWPSRLEDPVSVVYSDELLGSVWVLDQKKRALVQFRTNGERRSTTSLDFLGPVGAAAFRRVEVDRNGVLFVLEGSGSRLIKFEKRFIGVYGLGDKGAPLEDPSGLIVDSEDRIYVSDKGTDRIVRFDMNLN